MAVSHFRGHSHDRDLDGSTEAGSTVFPSHALPFPFPLRSAAMHLEHAIDRLTQRDAAREGRLRAVLHRMEARALDVAEPPL
jgi:hypothetical protein